MGKQEILPPLRPSTPAVRETVAPVRAPTYSSGDALDGMLTRWEADRDTRTLVVLTKKANALSTFIDAGTALLKSDTAYRQAWAELQDGPEKLAHERNVRRVDRAESYRHVQHVYEGNEMRRATDRAYLESALTDAQQHLRAQQEYGYTTHEIIHKKKQHELLDLDMEAEEKKAILRQHRNESDENDDGILDMLYRKRERLNARGLDTSKIDDVIERLQNGGGIDG
jgi:hypothetical protein